MRLLSLTSCLLLVVLSVLTQGNQQILQLHEQSLPRIAIIGAGAGGSSAAYYLQKYTNASYNISVFERSDYIGGRSTTIPVYGNSSAASTELVELGGSVFVDANRILTRAVKEFNLSTTAFAAGSDEENGVDGSVSVWDGTEFILELDSSWWRAPIKLLWRYGLSPLRARWSKDKFVGSFLQYYYGDSFPFNNLTSVVKSTHFDNATLVSGDDILAQYGVGTGFRHDLIQASTRCNYGQNLNQIHGVGAMVSLASDGAVQVSGGNWQIFRKFIEESHAHLHLSTTVESISKSEHGKWSITYQQNGHYEEELFDEVIVAAPINQTNIDLENLPSYHAPPSMDYVKLHVTIFTSNTTISPAYFGSPLSAKLSNYIFTTTGETQDPEFNSISLLTRIKSTGDYVYKIFSPQQIEAAFLTDELFKGKHVDITWWYRHVWYSYPYLKPTDQFGEFQLDDGLWYLNIIEGFASTMETSALAGASVAGLISKGKNTTQIVVP